LVNSGIQKYLFNKNHSLQIEIVDLAALTKTYGALLYTPHRTNFYHIFLFDRCSPKHIVDFQPVKILPYSLLFINKDNVHLFDRSSFYAGRGLIFTDDFFCITQDDKRFLRSITAYNDLFGTAAIPLGKQYAAFVSLFDQIDFELHLPADQNQHRIIKNMLHNVLLLAERQKRSRGGKELPKGTDLEYTMLFKDLLDERFLTLKKVSEYSVLLHLSEKRLTHATITMLGTTPKQMIDERVLLESKRLLSHTSNSIKEISFSLGFDEPSNFIKYFRKHTQQTPVEFRQIYSLQ